MRGVHMKILNRDHLISSLKKYLSLKVLMNKIYRFLFAGALNTFISYVIYMLLLNFMVYKIAYVVSYVFGVSIAYYLNSVFVFRSELSLKKYVQFPLIYLAQFFMSGAIILYTVELGLLSEIIAPLFAVIITAPFVFFLTRYVLEKKSS